MSKSHLNNSRSESAQNKPQAVPASDAPGIGEVDAELLPLDALKGLDSAVIAGFLGLSEATRHRVIVEYSQRHGEAAGSWLLRAASLWPKARLGVSRVILARLFAVLPVYMSQPERLELAKSIWHTARAPTKALLRVPPGYRNHAYLSQLVRDHFLMVLPSVMELPEALKSRVSWLNDPALQAQHDVLNLLLIAERDQLLLLADEQIEVLFARRLDGLEIRSSLAIAGHKLILQTDPDALEPVLRMRNKNQQATNQKVIDTRASRSVLIGAVIGGTIATGVTALIIFWIN